MKFRFKNSFLSIFLIASMVTPAWAADPKFPALLSAPSHMACQAILSSMRGHHAFDLSQGAPSAATKEAVDILRRFRQLTLSQPNHGPADKAVTATSKSKSANQLKKVGQRIESIEKDVSGSKKEADKTAAPKVILGTSFVGDEILSFFNEVNQRGSKFIDQAFEGVFKGTLDPDNKTAVRMHGSLSFVANLIVINAILVPFSIILRDPFLSFAVAYSFVGIEMLLRGKNVEPLPHYLMNYDFKTGAFFKEVNQILSNPLENGTWVYFSSNQKLLRKTAEEVLSKGTISDDQMYQEVRKRSRALSEKIQDYKELQSAFELENAKTKEEKKAALEQARKRLGQDEVWVMTDYLLDTVEEDGRLLPRLTVMVRTTATLKKPPQLERSSETLAEKLAKELEIKQVVPVPAGGKR